MPDNNPYRYCKPPKRHPGCQDTCETGIAWQRKRHEQAERVEAAHKTDLAVDSILKGKRRGNWR